MQCKNGRSHFKMNRGLKGSEVTQRQNVSKEVFRDGGQQVSTPQKKNEK